MITANDIVKANEVLKNVVERTPLDFVLSNCVELTMLSIN